MFVRWLGGLAVLAALVVVSGCGGGSDLPDLGRVSGTVTMDGKPLAGVVVTFEPVDGGRASIGKTDDNGQYELGYDAENKGAVVGKHRVRITTPTEAPDPNFKDPIPAKYNSNTTLTEEVKPGKNEINFELTSS
ncbi:MAG TPA: hypothetical protein EYP14_03065 [Planctomycetaceae bacterium]|nr:hypothetical protein [Planctomycetaceae bacterium]